MAIHASAVGALALGRGSEAIAAIGPFGYLVVCLAWWVLAVARMPYTSV